MYIGGRCLDGGQGKGVRKNTKRKEGFGDIHIEVI